MENSKILTFYNFLITSLSLLIGVIFVFGFLLLQVPTFKFFSYISYDNSLYLLTGFLALSIFLTIILIASIINRIFAYLLEPLKKPIYKKIFRIILLLSGALLSCLLLLTTGIKQFFVLLIIIVLLYWCFWKVYLGTRKQEHPDKWHDLIVDDGLVKFLLNNEFTAIKTNEYYNSVVTQYFGSGFTNNGLADLLNKLESWFEVIYKTTNYPFVKKNIKDLKENDLLTHLSTRSNDFKNWYDSNIELEGRKKDSYKYHASIFTIIYIVILMFLSTCLVLYNLPSENFITKLPRYLISSKASTLNNKSTSYDIYLWRFSDNIYGFEYSSRKPIIIKKELVDVAKYIYSNENLTKF